MMIAFVAGLGAGILLAVAFIAIDSHPPAAGGEPSHQGDRTRHDAGTAAVTVSGLRSFR